MVPRRVNGFDPSGEKISIDVSAWANDSSLVELRSTAPSVRLMMGCSTEVLNEVHKSQGSVKTPVILPKMVRSLCFGHHIVRTLGVGFPWQYAQE